MHSFYKLFTKINIWIYYYLEKFKIINNFSYMIPVKLYFWMFFPNKFLKCDERINLFLVQNSYIELKYKKKKYIINLEKLLLLHIEHTHLVYRCGTFLIKISWMECIYSNNQCLSTFFFKKNLFCLTSKNKFWIELTASHHDNLWTRTKLIKRETDDLSSFWVLVCVCVRVLCITYTVHMWRIQKKKGEDSEILNPGKSQKSLQRNWDRVSEDF